MQERCHTKDGSLALEGLRREKVGPVRGKKKERRAGFPARKLKLCLPYGRIAVPSTSVPWNTLNVVLRNAVEVMGETEMTMLSSGPTLSAPVPPASLYVTVVVVPSWAVLEADAPLKNVVPLFAKTWNVSPVVSMFPLEALVIVITILPLDHVPEDRDTVGFV